MGGLVLFTSKKILAEVKIFGSMVPKHDQKVLLVKDLFLTRLSAPPTLTGSMYDSDELRIDTKEINI